MESTEIKPAVCLQAAVCYLQDAARIESNVSATGFLVGIWLCDTVFSVSELHTSKRQHPYIFCATDVRKTPAHIRAYHATTSVRLRER
jgi:hypothetical protein